MTKSKNNQKSIDPALLRSLLEQAEGQDLFGQDGFFQQLKVSLAKSMLEGEMDHHLGYDKHDKGTKPTDNRRNAYHLTEFSELSF